MIFMIGLVVYQQGQEIALLKQTKQESLVVSNVNQTPPPSISKDQENKEILKTIFDTNKIITGEIKSIAGDTLSMEAMVSDEVGLKQADFSQPSSIALIQKVFQVNVLSKTIFTSKKLSELKIGDTIKVSSNESILETDTITANEISFIELPKIPQQ